MNCIVYKGGKSPDTYLYVTSEAALADVPEVVLKRLGELEPVLEFDLTPDRTLARTRGETIITAIRQQGFYIQLPPPREPSLAATLKPKEIRK